MDKSPDRLYELLPYIYRKKDIEQGYPLKAILRTINEQADLIEEDIEQLYANWFIETCDDWTVAYLGDLIGYRLVEEAGTPGEFESLQGRTRNRVLIPRREVANTIRYRRKKGTLALLELLANDVAGWPARAVEFRSLLSFCQSLNHLMPSKGRVADLRNVDALERLDGPFDEMAHTVDVRRISSSWIQGKYNIPEVGVYIWPLKIYSVTCTPACLPENQDCNDCYTFSVLGKDSPLFIRPEPEESPTQIAGENNLPAPLSRRSLLAGIKEYYGVGKSFQIWSGNPKVPVPPDKIQVADLGKWKQPSGEKVAVDPELGRLVLGAKYKPKNGVFVSYNYGFSDDLGGGEYDRATSQPAGAKLYRVGEGEEFKNISRALARWKEDDPKDAVIEITDSRVYEPEPSSPGLGEYEAVEKRIDIKLGESISHQSLQIRAASSARPIIRLVDLRVSARDFMTVTGEKGSRFVLDGFMVTNHGIRISGQMKRVTIRHCTMVPGIAPLRLDNLKDEDGSACRVEIDHCIMGMIQVELDPVADEPLHLAVADSILDSGSADNPVIQAATEPETQAHANLNIKRSTILGRVLIHTIDLAEECIFQGPVTAGRTQKGCMRFSYVAPNSVTPRRFNCQPDMAESEATRLLQQDNSEDDITQETAQETLTSCLEMARCRIAPVFGSEKYGDPEYCRLSQESDAGILRGAKDESEIGAFHDLFQPQRLAILESRLEEYTPAGFDVGVMIVDHVNKNKSQDIRRRI
jgi:hypothetical protein